MRCHEIRILTNLFLEKVAVVLNVIIIISTCCLIYLVAKKRKKKLTVPYCFDTMHVVALAYVMYSKLTNSGSKVHALLLKFLYYVIRVAVELPK